MLLKCIRSLNVGPMIHEVIVEFIYTLKHMTIRSLSIPILRNSTSALTATFINAITLTSCLVYYYTLSVGIFW